MSETFSIAIEGNIATGKSTFLKNLQQISRLNDKIGFFAEPVHKWQNINDTGLNLLDSFYSDPSRYAYLFQNYVYITRMLQYTEALKSPKYTDMCFFERSVFTDKMVFAKTAIENGFIQPIEGEVYKSWFETLVKLMPHSIPYAFIYLRAPPEVCSDRLKRRGRTEEASVELQYLKQIHECHEHWFIEGSNHVMQKECIELRKISGEKTHPLLDNKYVIVIDCEKDIKNDADYQTKMLDTFVEIITNIKTIYITQTK